jgi:hypothetical protein
LGYVEWKYLLHGIDAAKDSGYRNLKLPQPSYKIDTEIGHPLGQLPQNVAKAQPLFGADEREAQSLPVRNLLRSRALGLPSGQAVARAMGIPPLTGRDDDGQEARERELLGDKLDETTRRALEGNWPLWFYVLKEAEVLVTEVRTNSAGEEEDVTGAHLGAVGGRIVAEVLIGLLSGDPLSYLSVDPLWKPFLGPEDGRFTLSDLINFGARATN